MSKTKIFTLHFYQIIIDDSLFTESKNKITELLRQLNKVSKPNNVYEIHGYKAFVKVVDNNIYCFEKHRIDDLPSVGSVNNNIERNLKLNVGETLIEKNYFLIDDELGYIIFQEKLEGYRATSLSSYFHALLGEKTSKIHINQLLQTSSYERLLKYGYLKSMELSLASPSDDLLKEFGISLNDRILYKKNKNTTVSIKVTLDKKESIALQFIEGIKEKFRANSDKIKTLRIKGSETLQASLQDINLANDILKSKADVRIEDNQIVQDDMIHELNNAKRVHHEEIEGLLKG